MNQNDDHTAAPRQLQQHINRRFITAVSLGRVDEAVAALPQVDWTTIELGRNPMALVLNDHLFTSKTQREFADRNRALVADFAADNFEYEGAHYESDQGWEYTSHGNGRSSSWTKVIYLRPEWCPDDADCSTAHMSITFDEGSAPWSPDGCALTSCTVVDGAGNSFGSLPGLEDAHRSAAYGLPADRMPEFVLQVLQWCVDADRTDLIVTPAATLVGEGESESTAKFRLTGPLGAHVLARAARMGQVDVVEAAIDHGCDPLERIYTKDGAPQTVLEIIEKNDGENSAMLIRSILARRVAQHAVLEIEAEANGDARGRTPQQP